MGEVMGVWAAAGREFGSSSSGMAWEVLKFLHIEYYQTGSHFLIKMGAIESKIKSGYTISTKPLFTAVQKEAVQPCKNSTFTKSGCVSFDLQSTNTSEQDECENASIGKSSMKKPEAGGGRIIGRSCQYPYSSIGLVSCVVGEQKVLGSGCLIGDNFVLTCAHNLWSFKQKRIGKNISFTPMLGSSSEVTYQAKKVHVCQQLQCYDALSDEALLLDYAVIELQSENIQQDLGTMALNFNYQSTPNTSLSILGYNRIGRDVALCEFNGQTIQDGNLIKYEMAAGYGMSGAPIVVNNQDGFEVVGLHLFYRQRNGNIERGGIHLQERMLRDLEKWCFREQEELDLREKGLGKEGLKHLSKHKWSNLVSLNLSRNGFEYNTAKYLKRGHWKNLISFDLGGNLIGKEGAQALAQSEMTAIVTLNLWGNCIGKGGAYCISMAGWENLTNLNLYNNEIGDQGVQYLTHANWKSLNNLNLGKNGITFDGAQLILEGKWVNLTSLNLWGNDLSGEEMILKARLLEQFRVLKFLYF